MRPVPDSNFSCWKVVANRGLAPHLDHVEYDASLFGCQVRHMLGCDEADVTHWPYLALLFRGCSCLYCVDCVEASGFVCRAGGIATHVLSRLLVTVLTEGCRCIHIFSTVSPREHVYL